MLTNEKVLDVFKDYLSQGPDYEVVMTSHGYTVMGWDDVGKDWRDVQYCGTPEALRDALLDDYGEYLMYLATLNGCDSNRDLTEAEKAEIQAKQNVMLKKCQVD